MNEDQFIKRDRLRFKRNKMSANLTLLAILFDVLYFVSIYQSDVGTYYYTYMIGISVVYNLVFLLAAFLTEEAVKNYKREHSYIQIALGVGQIIRIFILPMKAHTTELDGALVMGNGQFTYLAVLLILSAVCLVASAVVNYTKCAALDAHMKMLAEQNTGRVSPSKVST